MQKVQKRRTVTHVEGVARNKQMMFSPRLLQKSKDKISGVQIFKNFLVLQTCEEKNLTFFFFFNQKTIREKNNHAIQLVRLQGSSNYSANPFSIKLHSPAFPVSPSAFSETNATLFLSLPLSNPKASFVFSNSWIQSIALPKTIFSQAFCVS